MDDDEILSGYKVNPTCDSVKKKSCRVQALGHWCRSDQVIVYEQVVICSGVLPSCTFERLRPCANLRERTCKVTVLHRTVPPASSLEEQLLRRSACFFA